jgi:glycosyltransferase involved in cell wall biosynthesis
MNARAKRLSSLSIFFPAYNDGRTIADLVLRAQQIASQLASDFEIIVVNDGSCDDTAAVLAALRAQVPILRVITHAVNRGYGGALRSGFAHACKDWVFYTDGDGQYDPLELERLAAIVDPTVDVVNGYKQRRSDSLLRVGIGAAYNAVVRFLFRLPVRDTDCDFRLIRRSRLAGVTLENDSGAICVELVKKLQNAGARFADVAVSHYHRRHGASQFFTLVRIWATLRQLTKLWWTLTIRKRAVMPHHEMG